MQTPQACADAIIELDEFTRNPKYTADDKIEALRAVQNFIEECISDLQEDIEENE